MSKEKRDYKKEYEEYHSKPEQIKNRAKRNQAREKLGLKKGDPREADHIKPLSKRGSNSESNLRAVSRKTNRKKGNKVDNLTVPGYKGANTKLLKQILIKLNSLEKRILELNTVIL